MKHKKIFLAILGIVLVGILAAILYVGSRVAPAVNHALKISELLDPLLNAENQTMHVAVSADVSGKQLALESDIFLVTEDGISYLAVEQNKTTVYVSDNVLILENGKAFKLGEKLQTEVTSYQNLLPQIALLYDVLTITATESETETIYAITVTPEQVETLLAVAALSETLPLESIETLEVRLVERNQTLEQILFTGKGQLEGSTVSLNVTLSGFRILGSGDYPIPETVKQTAATVNPDELFSLTKDLYRLVLAFAPFTEMESIPGTLTLTVDCGPLQLDTQLSLTDLQTYSSQVDPEQLQALPAILVWLCMEGDISCTPQDDTYVYGLKLDQQSMQRLTQMILPELAQYSDNLTEGNATILLKNNTVASITLVIEGKINALIVKIPIAVTAEFSFA